MASAPALRHRTIRAAATARAAPYAGLWRAERRIVHLDDGQVWTFTGRAEIRERSFAEDSQITTAGVSAPAARRYDLVPATGGEVGVRKGDGGAFVTLGRAPVQTVAHLCGPDLYEGRLVFPDPHRWIERWRVRGPCENYLSLSRHIRCTDD